MHQNAVKWIYLGEEKFVEGSRERTIEFENGKIKRNILKGHFGEEKNLLSQSQNEIKTRKFN